MDGWLGLGWMAGLDLDGWLAWMAKWMARWMAGLDLDGLLGLGRMGLGKMASRAALKNS
jgi:hypothetical protein